MATQLFMTDNDADTHRGTNSADLSGANVGWLVVKLQTSRGAGANTLTVNTVAGPTAGVDVSSGGDGVEWITEPVSADVTISGAITANLWGLESSMNANVAINFVVDVIRAIDNSVEQIVKSARTVELGTSSAAANFTATPGAGVTVNRGDRIRVRVFGDDSAAATMGSGFTFSFAYASSSAASNGDSYVTFTETFSFESTPSGTTLYLTRTRPTWAIENDPALLTAFTGADEDPLSDGGNWANLNSSGNPLKRVSNAAVASVAGAAASYWTPTNYGPDLEAYVTLVTVTGTQGILARIQGEGGANTWDGYQVAQLAGSNTLIQRYDNGAATTIAQEATTAWGNGDKIGMRIKGSVIEVWRFPSGGSAWQLLASATDTTYPNAGKIGLYNTQTNGSMDDLYISNISNLFTMQAWTARGAGVISCLHSSVSGWTDPIQIGEWFTKRLNAFTLEGKCQYNLRAFESVSSSFISLKGEIARVDADGTNPTVWAAWCIEPIGFDTGQLGTTEAARTVRISGDALSISNGQRLRLRIYMDNSSADAMVASRSVTFLYNGDSGGFSGDSWLILPMTISEFIPTSFVFQKDAPSNRALFRRRA